MGIAARGTDYHELLRAGGGGWRDFTFPSDRAFATPIAAASASRANRVDVLGTVSGNQLYHSFYQESLPGFNELYNQDVDNWCWADAAGMVINYLNLGTSGWTAQQSCQFVSTTDGENCCGASAPAECHHGGSSGDVLDAYGFDYDAVDPMAISTVRMMIQVFHQPVIAHEDHLTTSGGHLVVLRDVSRVGGIDYVEIADPANYGAAWVWPYVTFLAYATNWHVDTMLTDFARN